MSKRINIIGLLLLFLISTYSVNAASRQEAKLMTEYFDMVTSGNLESAGYLWMPDALERSSKFGITYDNIPLKVDASSPLIRQLEHMRSYLQPPIKNIITLPEDYSQLIFSTVIEGYNFEYTYYAQKSGDYYWFIYPQDYYSRDWPSMETEYFDIIYHPDMKTYLNPVVLKEADAYVEKMAKIIGLGKEDLNLIREKKITYFYCDNDKTVKNMIGHMVKGTYDQASNDIISAFFPHYHELTHFLINYHLRELSLYTLPLLREGLAVHLSGRWGKSPEALNNLAAYLYQMEIVTLDSILTLYGFEKSATSDIAYPVSGLFTGFLINEYGWENYLEMYRSFSEPIEYLSAYQSINIKNRMVKITGAADWDEMINSFEKYIDEVLIDEAVMLPGRVKKGKEILSGDNFKLYKKGDWLGLEVTISDDTLMRGNLIYNQLDELSNFRSSIFEEQYRDTISFEGYRFGIRYDRNEAGVYDYATNHLLAKYIWGITPSDEYIDNETKTLFFKFHMKVVNGILPQKDKFKLLSN